MILDYACCNVPVMPMRREPSHCSEQVSQLLYGEKAEILNTNNGWTQIRSKWDNYEGWCTQSQLNIISKKEYVKEARYLAVRNADKLLIDDVETWIPAGAELKKASYKSEIGDIKFKGKKHKSEELICTPEALLDAAKLFLNAPYQWGGRTIAGIDCSGLSQMAYKLCNKQIPRDASRQASEGTTIDFLQHATPGDLAFFDNEEGYINHVGILMDSETIIHATETVGRVVVDKIDQGGIISTRLRKRTHNLRLVRRYI